MVRNKDVAHHAGNWNYNTWSVGIEHEGFINDPSWFTTQMYQASAALTRYICDFYGIKKTRTYIIGHSEVPGSTHTDPGPNWNWNYYMSLVTGGRTPDLTVTSLTGPSVGTIGKQIQVSVTVANQGASSAGAFRLGFYFSTNSTITTSDTYSGFACNFSGLAAGTSGSCSGPIGVPVSLTPGVYYLGAIADDVGQVAESNENNNARAADTGPVTLTLPTVTLTVSKTGPGSGTGTSSPAGINCGSTCSAPFPQDTSVTLTATAASGSAFAGWSGEGGSGTSTCTVSMSQARTVTATFTSFSYTLTNTGPITVTPGAAGQSTITATLSSGTAQTVSFNVQGIPSGATASFAPTSCTPTCSTILTIATNASTPSGTFAITVTGSPLNKTTTLNLAVIRAPLICDIQMSQTSYVNDEKVTAHILLTNAGGDAVPVEIGLWFEVPGLGPIPYTNVGADGTVILPPGFSQNVGPLTLFEVTSSLPRGSYTFNCRMVDPVTFEPQAEDLNSFAVQ